MWQTSRKLCYCMEKDKIKLRSKEPTRYKSRAVGKMKIDLGCGKTKEKFKLASWNINGLRSSIGKNTIRQFLLSQKPDILCLNQTKIDQEAYFKNQISLDGYSSYWYFCQPSMTHTGITIFSKFLPISIAYGMQEKQPNSQSRVLTLQFQHFYLISVLAPNAGKKLERLDYKINSFQTNFYRYCNKIKQIGKGVIICGDLNTAVEHKDTHFHGYTNKTAGFTDVERKNMRKFMATGWVDIFRKLNPDSVKYTWWHMEHSGRQLRIGKRFDYFLIDYQHSGMATSSLVLEEYLSKENSPIVMEVNMFLIEKEIDRLKYVNFAWKKVNSQQGKLEQIQGNSKKSDEIDNRKEENVQMMISLPSNQSAKKENDSHQSL